MIVQATHTVLFYLIAALALVMALSVVFSRKLLRAAIALMGVLALTAGLYILLGAEFLAGVQVLVYVGGIVVLIVFAIMLTRSSDLLEDQPTLPRALLGAFVGLVFLVMSSAVFFSSPFQADTSGAQVTDDTVAIGRSLLDYGPKGYVLPFEIISLLLLAAAIGGIVIARKIPAPSQPFTSGGDLPGEADFTQPRSQREEA